MPVTALVAIVVFLLDVFVGHFLMSVLVVDGIGAHDDFWPNRSDGGVGLILKMLVGDAAIFPYDLVKPLRKKREVSLDHVMVHTEFQLRPDRKSVV